MSITSSESESSPPSSSSVISTSKDTIYGEKVELEFDLMQTMLRESYSKEKEKNFNASYKISYKFVCFESLYIFIYQDLTVEKGEESLLLLLLLLLMLRKWEESVGVSYWGSDSGGVGICVGHGIFFFCFCL